MTEFETAPLFIKGNTYLNRDKTKAICTGSKKLTRSVLVKIDTGAERRIDKAYFNYSFKHQIQGEEVYVPFEHDEKGRVYGVDIPHSFDILVR